ncbi:NAD(P)H dehydrogenase (quinone) [Chitinophaga pinensis DSM 2588]|uniref:FMN dependent NADH:quinone oxidoreductase n=2 Tax=Chitinophaga pinensis TaxID=79329 RepID=A0A979G421_CHIPD|nr:NAD(P)H dehydrogenase (quinone) [Chitinophaga pinensis DSM 2588]
MNKVLIINASARKERSLSRYMTNVFVETWQTKYPDDAIVYREVGQESIPHVTETWIAGAFKPAALRTAAHLEALKISDQLIAELKEANVIVVGSPMYNWSVPSALKAYIDQVLRVNETVLVSKDNPENPYTGLLKEKKVYLLMVRGNDGYGSGEYYEHMDFQSNYLRTVFTIMGLEDISAVTMDGVDMGAKLLDVAAEKVKRLIV